ncbi:family 16 glycosylhydrolase [Actinoplanes sp. CA-131856]
MTRSLRIPIAVTLAALLTVGQAVIPTPALAADFPANPATKSGYTLDFDQEFNTSSLDTSKWLPYYLPHWSTRDLSAARYDISGGALNLRIDADQPAWDPVHDADVKVSSIQTYERDYLHQFDGFSSGMQINHHEPVFNGYTTRYGYFEMRAKGPDVGGGGHSAWWMVGTQEDQDAAGTGSRQTAEIDITENFFSEPNQWKPNLRRWTDSSISNSPRNVTISGDPADEYHIYAMNWTPDGLQFYYDNQLITSMADAPNYPMGMLLGIYTDTKNSGTANDVWPKTWNIDYIRVYKDNNGYTTESGPYRIKNRNTGQYMHLQDKTGQVQLSTTVPAGYWSSQWYVETYQGNTYLRNRWSRAYLNNQAKTAITQYGPVQFDWWSAQWTLQDNGNYKRLLNRNSSDYLHAQNKLGYVEEGAAPSTWWSADWTLEPVS